MDHKISKAVTANGQREESSPGGQVTAVLLVGGTGTRLQSVVASTPKPLATVGERPFLELLVRQLRNQGIRRLVMCTGYLADQIEKQFGDGRSSDLEIEYSKEPSALGTAGAIKFAQPHLKDTSDFLVLNGDSFFEMDFIRFIQFHRESNRLASMAVLRMKNDRRYGTVRVDANGRVTGFAEKIDSDPSGLVNAGVYAFNSAIFDQIPDGPVSLEKDVFPRVLGQGIYTFEHKGLFIDIGTPEDYLRAQGLWQRLCEATEVSQQASVVEPAKD